MPEPGPASSTTQSHSGCVSSAARSCAACAAARRSGADSARRNAARDRATCAPPTDAAIWVLKTARQPSSNASRTCGLRSTIGAEVDMSFSCKQLSGRCLGPCAWIDERHSGSEITRLARCGHVRRTGRVDRRCCAVQRGCRRERGPRSVTTDSMSRSPSVRLPVLIMYARIAPSTQDLNRINASALKRVRTWLVASRYVN